MKISDLEDGRVLKEQLKELNEKQDEETFAHLFTILKDSMVWVPCHTSIPLDDESLEEDIEFEPDILENNGRMYLPVFSSDQELLKDYEENFTLVHSHFMDVMAWSIDDETLTGMILNPFTDSFLIPRDLYEFICDLPSEIDDDTYLNPAQKALDKGSHYYNLNTPEGFKKAEEYYLYAAKLFDAQAMCNLGYIYTYGRVGKPDKVKGLEYFQKAADKFNIEGSMKVADAYRYGDIYEKNEKLAVAMYNDIYHFIRDHNIMNEYPEILLRMGEIYYEGIVVDIDYGESVYYFSLAKKYFADSENEIFYYKGQKEKASHYLEKSLKALRDDYVLKKLKNIPFRKLNKRTFYIECPEIMEKVLGSKELDGAIVYGYIDHNQGLSMRLLASCTYNEKEQKVRIINPEYNIVLRRNQIQEAGYLAMDYRLRDDFISNFTSIYQQVDQDNEVEDPSLEILRYMPELDSLRSEENPDDIQVHLIVDENLEEMVWVRCEKIVEGNILGTLLTEPEFIKNVHEGYYLTVRFGSDENGNPMCAALVEQQLMN